jgi:hypothetical protein
LGKDISLRDWLRLCKGLADYRRGILRAALEELDALVPQSRPPGFIAYCHLVLAMALHRQGQAKAARVHLGRAAKILDQCVADPDRFPRV